MPAILRPGDRSGSDQSHEKEMGASTATVFREHPGGGNVTEELGGWTAKSAVC